MDFQTRYRDVAVVEGYPITIMFIKRFDHGGWVGLSVGVAGRNMDRHVY